MRIAHISDFHYTHLSLNLFGLLSKRILGTLNWLFLRRNQFCEDQLDSVPDLLEELGVDLVLFGGDFSTTSLTQEFEKAKKFISRIKKPWIAIPGNHDAYTYRSCRNKHFYRFFSHEEKEITDPIQFFNLKEHRIAAHKMDEKWWVVTLDTALATNPYSSQGKFSEKLEAYLNEVLQLIPKDASILLLNHYPFFQNDVARHNLIRGEALEALLKKNKQIKLYLHGHTHRHTIADLQVSDLPIVLDPGSCAQGVKGSFNIIDLQKDACKVSTFRFSDKWTNTQIDEMKWTR